MPIDDAVTHFFTSAHTLRQRIADMADGFGWESWSHATTPLKWNDEECDFAGFYYRYPIQCAKWLMAPHAFEDHMVYAPKRWFYNGVNGKPVQQ